jgi:serine/threonine-protein kinase RsbW
MGFGWHVAEREVYAMAQRQTANGGPDLRLRFARGCASHSLLEIEAWMRSEIKAISPLTDRLMRLIEGSRCVAGDERAVELALREALSNAVIHGNGMDAHKLVRIRCRCELGKGVSIIVTDSGQGFDPNAVPDLLAVERLGADHGRGIHLMKLAMDEVSFERGGTEVHMRKGPTRNPRTALQTNVIVPPTGGQVQPAGLDMTDSCLNVSHRNRSAMPVELMNANGRANATSFSADRTAKTEDQ